MSFRRTGFKLLIGCAAAWAAIAASSAYGNRGESLFGIQSALDAAFKVALPVTQPAEAVLPPINIDDGRSKVSNRWRGSLEGFALADRDHAPAPGGVVFVGSSSIALWGNLESQFASSHALRRGLSGARMADVAHYADRLVLPYQPRLVVVYAGDNDLAEGVSPEAVLAAYNDLVRQIHRAMPETRIAFVSVKPSPLRESLMPVVTSTNDLIANYTSSDPKLDYIDVYGKMLDEGGHARPELFQKDGLHPNAAGYAIWKTAIADHLR